jgi:hypothetical protein
MIPADQPTAQPSGPLAAAAHSLWEADRELYRRCRRLRHRSPCRRSSNLRCTGGSKPARFERPGELRDDAPFGRRGRTGQRKRERVLDGQGGLRSHRCTLQFCWPNVDQRTRTYVNSRKLR